MVNSILVINGTPREGGNTDLIIDKLIEGAESGGKDIQYFKLRNLIINNCIGCCTCKRESRCHFQDDMTQIRQFIEKSDIMIFASPIY